MILLNKTPLFVRMHYCRSLNVVISVSHWFVKGDQRWNLKLDIQSFENAEQHSHQQEKTNMIELTEEQIHE